MNRRNFLRTLGVGAAALAGSSCVSRARRVEPRPNIVYINVDDLGWTNLGYQGSRFYETPNIDRLASQAVVFSSAYAPAANCAPSRACCFTGQYAPRHGIYTVETSVRGRAAHRRLIPIETERVLPDDSLTIAEALKAGGYKTCHVGKWHLGEDARSQGFDSNVAGSLLGYPYKGYFSPYGIPHLRERPEGEYLTDRLTDEAIRFIESHRDAPFFLHFSPYAVHTPLQAKQEKIAKYKKKAGSDRHNNPIHAAMVETLDENIGRLLKRLDELDLAHRTLILFSSDNGGAYRASKQWPLRAGKGSYYEGGIRVPMMVRWPARVEPGGLCDLPVSGMDFYPTFLEAAGLPVPEGKVLDGTSLIPLLTRRGYPEGALFWHYPIYLEGGNGETRDPLFRTRPTTVMRLGDWKLHEFFEDGGIELYNLREDIGELTNLAEQMPEKVKELHDIMRAWREDVNAPVPTKLNPRYDPVAEQKALEHMSGFERSLAVE
jgi:arylsulfatase A-like enzyme